MSEYCKNCYRLQKQYEMVVEQNRELQKENRELRANMENIVNRTIDIVLEKLHIKHDRGGIKTYPVTV